MKQVIFSHIANIVTSVLSSEGYTDSCCPNRHRHVHLQMQEEAYLYHEGPHSSSTHTLCPAPLRQEAEKH